MRRWTQPAGLLAAAVTLALFAVGCRSTLLPTQGSSPDTIDKAYRDGKAIADAQQSDYDRLMAAQTGRFTIACDADGHCQRAADAAAGLLLVDCQPDAAGVMQATTPNTAGEPLPLSPDEIQAVCVALAPH